MKDKSRREPVDFSGLRPPSSYLDDVQSFLNSVDGAQRSAQDYLDRSLKALGGDAPAAPSGEPAAQTSGTPAAQAEAAEPAAKPDLNALLAELDGLVGLERVKANVKSLVNLVKVRALRQKSGLPTPPMSLHLVFMGNPGTGKTTVARLVARLYQAIGVLSKGQLVEVDRSGLVAGYVGQTAIRTGEVIRSALGGVLFIDEAYSLAQSDGQNDFGREAVDTLLKAMEDNRADFVVIVAGYEKLMEKLIASNPGLESRFNRYFVFEDYNGAELNEIFLSMCAKNGYEPDGEAKAWVREKLERMYEERDENFGNARDVRNLFENAVSAQSDRVAGLQAPTVEDLKTLTKGDLEQAETL